MEVCFGDEFALEVGKEILIVPFLGQGRWPVGAVAEVCHFHRYYVLYGQEVWGPIALVGWFGDLGVYVDVFRVVEDEARPTGRMTYDEVHEGKFRCRIEHRGTGGVRT